MKQVVKFFVILNICIIFIGGFFLFQYKSFLSKNLTDQEIIVKIKKGETFQVLPNKISNINPIALKIYFQYNNPDYVLAVGKYKIPKNANIKQVIQALKKPINEEIKITILEGRNIFDIDNYLFKKGLIKNRNDYIQYVTNKNKITQLSQFFPFIKNQESIEGFLYPDTYMVKTHFQINAFVIQQLENFEIKVYNTLLRNKGYSLSTIYDIINLASIVEKEEKNITHKPIIAGILKKRLQEGWMIGADITVCYPYKLTSKECKNVVTKYINKKNNYNTRTMKGLPKTPIGNPSFETIYATINDQKTDYYYYLHNVNTGKVYYGKNNLEHSINKKYMK